MRYHIFVPSMLAATLAFSPAVSAQSPQSLTRDNGAPVGDNQNSQTAGEDGPVLLQDVHLVQKLQRFARERIPERVVHARGTGAHGSFTVTGDITRHTRAVVFKPGTTTPVFVRFSTVIHGNHSPETLRDPRGFATKFYTKEGNWDLVGNNLPVFFIRDAIKFPDMVHSLKPSPDTNVQDPARVFDFFSHVPESTHMLTRVYSDFGTPRSYREMDGNNLPVFFIRDAIKFPDMVHSLKPSPDTNVQDPARVFDFFSHVPESTHMLTRVYSDFGTPRSYREMDGNGVHAYKLVNENDQYVYVKFRWDSRQSEHNLSAAEVEKVQGRDFNHLSNDLVKAIARGDYPQWDLYVQILTPEQLDSFDFNPLDATKVWTDIPEVKVGTMTLDRNPANVFQETEQAAFAPANLVPGIEPSEDRLLQGRMFSYADTQLYRVGTNVNQLPINAPRVPVNSNNQDGALNAGARKGKVNYEPSRIEPKPQVTHARSSALPVQGTTVQARIGKTLNFRQAGEFYRSLSQADRKNLVANLAGDLGQVSDETTRYTMLSYFHKADAEYGVRLTQALKSDVTRVQAMSAALSE